MRAIRIWAASALAVATVAAAPAESGWAVLARQDIGAIHDILRDNHPGAVDPENPAFARWLEGGLVVANADADRARTYAAYRRAVRRYVNGFRDGHVQLGWAVSNNAVDWPGFLVSAPEPGRLTVSAAADDSRVPLGAELKSCDGKTPDQLLRERTDPILWNADIPHARWRYAPNLFWSDAGDIEYRMKSCTFNVGGVDRTETLTYRQTSRQVATEQFWSRASGAAPRSEMGLRKVGDLWVVGLPTFINDGKNLPALVRELETRAPDMRNGKIAFDLRGNAGGDSGWVDRIATAIWGQPVVQYYAAGLDHTFDARASKANIEHVREIGRRDPSWVVMADRMQASLDAGRPYARIDNPPRTVTRAPPASPVVGRVFMLTDGACASACLNFADLMRRIPGVRHVGLPTSADAIYIDNVETKLPSGLASFSYGFKVYRKRVRGNNERYEPQVLWPGGEMTDAAVFPWISGLR